MRIDLCFDTRSCKIECKEFCFSFVNSFSNRLFIFTTKMRVKESTLRIISRRKTESISDYDAIERT